MGLMMKSRLSERLEVLDHGYIRLVEPWGQGDGWADYLEIPSIERDYEKGIIEAARQSTQGTFRSWDTPDETGRTDQMLLEWLYKMKHSGPFEFSGMTIDVMAPIAVFREWHRHRTQSYNEMSARYAALPDLVYIPTIERALLVNEAGKNKQAAGVSEAPKLTFDNAAVGREMIKKSCARARSDYHNLLQMGWAKELARGVLPVFQYSKMRASGNLRNWLAFLTLRTDSAAQWEIRQFAFRVGEIIDTVFPRTWELFDASRKGVVGT